MPSAIGIGTWYSMFNKGPCACFYCRLNDGDNIQVDHQIRMARSCENAISLVEESLTLAFIERPCSSELGCGGKGVAARYRTRF
jgi:hypothetical protein